MSLSMRLTAAQLHRTRHPLWSSADKVREHMALPRHSAPVPHEFYQVNHVVTDQVSVPAGTFTVHHLVPATDAPRDTPLDICVYLHGGAYINGLDDRHWSFLTDLAAGGMKVIVPDYGLAPGFGATAARDLLDTVLTRAAEEAAGTGHRLCLAGDSAGGGLALGWLLTTSRTGAAAAIDRIGLISPWLDVTCTTPGLDALIGSDPWLHPAGLRIAGAAWASEVGPDHPLVSPLTASDDLLQTLPDVGIWTGTRDILHADATVLTDRLAALDGRTGRADRTEVSPGAIHVHPLTRTPEGRAARRDIVAWLARRN
ncbi:alpha/beta hydrolase fold domain-containing protein [Corynebacterium terpenotabidum]|nr:alpha/beta hydrolase fold domain-containing protein [Corynebacterium terpenotabidum]